MAVRTTEWTGLERAIDGEVVLPGSAGWEAARRPALARFRDAWPAAVVRCATPGDVAGTIAFARQAELPLAARSGGHCLSELGRLSSGGEWLCSMVCRLAPRMSGLIWVRDLAVGDGMVDGSVRED